MFGEATLASQVAEYFAAGAVIQLRGDGQRYVGINAGWEQQLTSMYRHSESAKVVINVVIKG